MSLGPVTDPSNKSALSDQERNFTVGKKEKMLIETLTIQLKGNLEPFLSVHTHRQPDKKRKKNTIEKKI